MNLEMWRKAVSVIPIVSKNEWQELDIISKWLISTRAAVLVMTCISSVLAGLFALRDYSFSFLPWLGLSVGLILAHASNNLLNDYTDFVRGVDQKNYYRAAYGIQPLVHGLMTKTQHLEYFAASGLLSLTCGLYLVWQNQFDPVVWILLASGAFFLLFYTWPLKYIALGEVAVFTVWGPLMVGGGYYVITHQWDWNVVGASLIYAFGVTTVIFGKHIDKIKTDSAKHIRTLPVLLGERYSRFIMIGLMFLPYLILAYLIWIGYFSPVVMIVLFATSRLRQILPTLLQPKPETRPANFPEGQGGWPLFFAPLAFWYNRRFGLLFVLGVIADIFMRMFFPS